VIVLDASAAVELVLGTAVGSRVRERVGGSETLHAPHLIDLEVAQALRRLVTADEITAHRADGAVSDLGALRVRRYPHDVLLPRVWALRDGLTAYDAAYVALAEALDAPLVTRDARLARSGGHQATIELIAPEGVDQPPRTG
jgi:predicted nucleic acid-binding protein